MRIASSFAAAVVITIVACSSDDHGAAHPDSGAGAGGAATGGTGGTGGSGAGEGAGGSGAGGGDAALDVVIPPGTPTPVPTECIPDLLFANPPEIPYGISEGCIWSRTYTTGQVLTHYREMYRPGPGSPLVDAGDPADGAGTDIGAIGEGTNDPKDSFGLVIP
jgi:hypothetical protein